MKALRRKRSAAPVEDASTLLRFFADGAAECAPAGNGRLALRRSGAMRLIRQEQLETLAASDLVAVAGTRAQLTDAGLARLKRMTASDEPFLAQHGELVRRRQARDDPVGAHLVNAAESPLVWLARRRDRDGRPFLDAAQLEAGERMRTDFTRAGLTPRVTANWIAPVAQARRGARGDGAAFADVVLAAKERLARALDAVGPEFSGLLLDVCCFLKGLETVERERRWPPRTARVVLSLALDRLARHYGISAEAWGPARARTRAWQAEDARPTMDAG